MAALTWDGTGEKFYQNGVNHGVLYVQKSDGTYEDGVAWNGLTGVDESPDGGEANDLWADNIKYASLRSVENFKGSISAYHYPDEFNACDGKIVTADGVVIGQQKRQSFGFCYRTEIGNDTSTGSDDGYIIHVIWNATVNPSDRSYETVNDSPDAVEFSWDFECLPVAFTSGTGNAAVNGYTSSMELNSLKLGSGKMAAAEALLYGGQSADPTLPTPTALLAAIAAATNE